MASTPKRRIRNPKYSSPSSSSSPMRVLSSIEPPPSLLPSKTDVFKLVSVVSIAVSVAVVCNYVVNFFNRQPKPFCDTDSESDFYLSDVCDPCPIHAICYEGKLECISGYTRHGRSCLEDGNINEIAKNLVKMVESHVCESYSRYLCKGINKIWFEGDELWNSMDKVKVTEDYGKDNTTYLFAKKKAMDIVDNLLEMRDTNFDSIKEFKCPELLVENYKPLSCNIRLWLLEHALFLIPFCVLLVGCICMLLKVRHRHYLSLRSEQLYEEVCETLEEAALVSNGESEPWIVASWLRDNLLTPKERRDPMLWKKVEELVQEDSRLDRYPKMLKGEPKVVWEWQVEGGMRSSGKRKKKKGGEVKKDKSSDNIDLGSNQDNRREPLKW